MCKTLMFVSLAGYILLDIVKLLIVCFLSLALKLKRHALTWSPC